MYLYNSEINNNNYTIGTSILWCYSLIIIIILNTTLSVRCQKGVAYLFKNKT